MDKTFQNLEKTLRLHARGLRIPAGSAEVFIAETLKSVEASLHGKSIITEQDLKRLVIKELKKYHKDFAYVYANCDIII
ncbi:hypothetical protein IJ118_01115 [Candidatus Saccharibacteria bacterium]|nr:hypothetical protein [Candidatus Saccharibacteria bacterium]